MSVNSDHVHSSPRQKGNEYKIILKAVLLEDLSSLASLYDTILFAARYSRGLLDLDLVRGSRDVIFAPFDD